MTIAIRRPAPDELALRWHQIAPILSRATRRSRCYEPIDVLLLVLSREWLLWLIEIEGDLAAVVVCKVQPYPRRKVLEMKMAAGSRMHEWLGPAQQHFERVARETGCDTIASTGRRGWARVCGGAQVDTVCVRELQD